MTARAYVALLRAVNLPDHHRVSGTALRELVEGLGFDRVRTLLASGNIVFEGPPRDPSSVEARLEAEGDHRLGLRTQVFVRTREEWSAMIGRNPFPDEARRDPAHLLVVALRRPPAPTGIDGLRARIRGRERVSGWDRYAYAVYPDGVGRSKLTLDLIESALGSPGTARNWNTVTRLERLLSTGR